MRVALVLKACVPLVCSIYHIKVHICTSGRLVGLHDSGVYYLLCKYSLSSRRPV